MNYLNSRIKYYFNKVYERWNYDVQKTLVSLGKLHVDANRNKLIQSPEEAEFQVFSQRGEDGIIQYLINNIDIPNKVFVEFGVENYTESNTRFLLINNNWAGLVIDGSKEHVQYIKSSFIYWKYDLTAYNSFITKDNINELIGSYTSCKDIGLLSVDIDGNDYWVWEAIDVINPRIVICEYNSIFGADKQVSVIYNDRFTRRSAHFSDLYFGASLAAFVALGEKKGYDFIGVASTGVNAFFVRKDLSGPFKKTDAASGFRQSPNRDSRDERGNLSFIRHNERLDVVKEMPVYDLQQGKPVLIKDLYNI
jgi:hypothetical protein